MSHIAPSSMPQLVRAALLTALLAATGTAQTTWYVAASNAACPGSGTVADPFCTIGAAIAAAAPGDTIEVAAGRYAETVVIAKDALILRGEGASVTEIVGPGGAAPVGPGGFAAVPDFTLEGFRITTSDPDPSYLTGVWANPDNQPGALWTIRGCVIEDFGIGIQANDAWDGAQLLIEDTVVTRCQTGMMVIGDSIAIRRCTIQDIGGVGVYAPGPTIFEVSDTIIASTGWWAVQRYANWPTTLQRLLIHDNNLDNPPTVPNAGPFMQYLAEGWPGGFGIWTGFTPSPGPVLQTDPLFVDAASGDVRLRSGSPAIDAGDPGAAAVPGAYDLLGFGHPRVDDGDFDGTERIDLGAIEFGGLLLNGGLEGAFSTGQVLTATLAGPPGAAYGVFAGLPGEPIDFGAKGTFFLAPAPLALLVLGVLPSGGEAVVLSAPLPAAATGLELALQAAHKTAATHWTNLERLVVGP